MSQSGIAREKLWESMERRYEAWKADQQAREVDSSEPKKTQRRQRSDRERRDQALRVKYGIGLEQYEEMLAKQGGVCAICESPPRHQARPLNVDHCHKSGKVRGLLCTPCNAAIGGLRDSPELMRKAIEYVTAAKEGK